MTQDEQASAEAQAASSEPQPPAEPPPTTEQLAAEQALSQLEDRSGAFTPYALAADFLELREILAGSFERVKPESWERRTTDRRPQGWTLRQTLAHLDAVAQLYNYVAAAGLAGEPVQIPNFARREDLRAVNDAAMEARAELPVAELCASLLSALDEGARVAGQLGPEQLGRQVAVPFFGATPTVAELLGASLCHAGIVHGAQIATSRSRPLWIFYQPGMMRRQLTRFFHVFGLAYWPERGGSLYATVQFSAAGQGGGSWYVRATPQGGYGRIGIARTIDLSMRFASADLLCRVLTGAGLPWRQIVLQQLRLAGNLALARRLPSLFTPT